MKLNAIALLSAALAITSAGAEVQLLPAKEFVGRNGQPGGGRSWQLSDEQGRELAAWLSARHKTVKFNFDYEHQQMLTEKNGQPAPAAGWSTTFEWRDGQGLWATDVEWTARAKAHIEAREYLYISPVIAFDKKTGVVTAVLNAALVNIPELEMSAIDETVARLNASFLTTQEQSPMNPILKALLAGLGLTEAATEAEATSALAALKAKATQADSLSTEVVALKAATPDPSKWVPLEKFSAVSTELAALSAKSVERDVEEVIAQAKAEGKVVPAVEAVWRDIGKVDIAKLKSLVAGTPANPALAGKSQTQGKGNDGQQADGELSEAELAVCKATGQTVEAFKAAKFTAQA